MAFNFKMPAFMKSGGGPSPLSQMDTSGKLQALGSAFSGDQEQLAQLLASLGGQGGAPVMNVEGADISAAFGGGLPQGGPGGLPPMMGRPGPSQAAPATGPMPNAAEDLIAKLGLASGLPALAPRRRFGFGGR